MLLEKKETIILARVRVSDCKSAWEDFLSAAYQDFHTCVQSMKIYGAIHLICALFCILQYKSLKILCPMFLWLK